MSKNAETLCNIHYSFSFIFFLLLLKGNLFFTIPWPKLSLSLPVQKRACGIFGPSIVKNSLRSTGVKLDKFFLPRCVTYYYIRFFIAKIRITFSGKSYFIKKIPRFHFDKFFELFSYGTEYKKNRC